MNKGLIIALDTPQNIKQSINKEVVEVVCSPVKKAYEVIRLQTNFDAQMFGDMLNVVLDSFDSDFARIETLLRENKIKILDKRIITPSLENVFMYKIKEAG